MLRPAEPCAPGDEHTLVVTEAGELWACGRAEQGRLGLNGEQDRHVPTRVDPQHFAHAPISTVAAGESHSAAVTASGTLYNSGGQQPRHLGQGAARHPRVPGGLGHADLDLAKLVPHQLLSGTRVGWCHGLLEGLALAFAMGTHERLGGAGEAGGGVGAYGGRAGRGGGAADGWGRIGGES
jgi:hypothetical protein